MDWKNLIMTFVHDNKKIIIKRDPSLTKTQVSLKSLVKMWTDFDQGYLTEFRSLEAIMPHTETQEEAPEIEEAVKTVLSKYQDVFD